ncbi:hypothetical protein ACOMHN_048018 [Nucella lapillus]
MQSNSSSTTDNVTTAVQASLLKALVKSTEWSVPKEQTFIVTIFLWTVVTIGFVFNTLLLIKLFTVKWNLHPPPPPPILVNLCLSNLLLVFGAFLAALTLSFDLGGLSVKAGKVEVFISVGVLLQSWLGQIMVLFSGTLTRKNHANSHHAETSLSAVTNRTEKWTRPQSLTCRSISRQCLYQPYRPHSRLTQTFKGKQSATDVSSVRSRAVVLEAASVLSMSSRGRRTVRWWLGWSWLLSLLAATALLMTAAGGQDGCLTLVPFQTTYMIPSEDINSVKVRENSLNKVPFLLVLVPVYIVGVGGILWSVITTSGSQCLSSLRKPRHATVEERAENVVKTWTPISLSNLRIFGWNNRHRHCQEEIQIPFESGEADTNVNAIELIEQNKDQLNVHPIQTDIGVTSNVNTQSVINPNSLGIKGNSNPEGDPNCSTCFGEENNSPANHRDGEDNGACEDNHTTVPPTLDNDTKKNETEETTYLVQQNIKMKDQNPNANVSEAQPTVTSKAAESRDSRLSAYVAWVRDFQGESPGVGYFNQNNSANCLVSGTEEPQQDTENKAGVNRDSASSTAEVKSESCTGRMAGGAARPGMLQLHRTRWAGKDAADASSSSGGDLAALHDSYARFHTEASSGQRNPPGQNEASGHPEVSNLRLEDTVHAVARPLHHTPAQVSTRQQWEGTGSQGRGIPQGGLRPAINIVSSSMHHFTIEGRPPWPPGRFELYPPGWLKQERFPLLPIGHHSSRQQCPQQQQQQQEEDEEEGAGTASDSSRKRQHGGARSRLSARSSCHHRKAPGTTCRRLIDEKMLTSAAEIHSSASDSKSAQKSSSSCLQSETRLKSHLRNADPDEKNPTQDSRSNIDKQKAKAYSSWNSLGQTRRSDDDTRASVTEYSCPMPVTNPSVSSTQPWSQGPFLSSQQQIEGVQSWSPPRHVKLVSEGDDDKSSAKTPVGSSKNPRHPSREFNTGAGGGDSCVSDSKPKRYRGKSWWSFGDGLSYKAKCWLGLTMHVILCLPLAVTLGPGIFQDSDCGIRLRTLLVTRLVMFCHVILCPVWVLCCFPRRIVSR